jgi:Lrp/AsnC family transcriptional regulator, leucine-responsive regulatory protein
LAGLAGEVAILAAPGRRLAAISHRFLRFSRGFSPYSARMELDRYDRQLLQLIQDDIGVSAERLAERVPLSASSIQRRLRRLREHGVIEREVAVLNPEVMGRPTFFVVSLRVERERPELLDQLRRWLAAQEHIQQAFYVTGESDFILVVAAPDTESYDRLMGRLITENPNVSRFTTNVALSVVKRGLSIPIPPDPAD